METFDWIPERVCLDLENVYGSPNVISIEANFFTCEPGRKFDFEMPACSRRSCFTSPTAC